MGRKGSAAVVILLVLAGLLAIGGGIWYYGLHRAPPPFGLAPASGTQVASSSMAPAVAATSSSPSDWKTYTNTTYGFALEYPPDFNVEAQSSTDPSYDLELRFTTGTSTAPLELVVTDLGRYLPLTETPKLNDYIQTFKQLDRYHEATIGSKHAYEYQVCGWASCSQSVVFINNNEEYEFYIENGAYVPDGYIADPASMSFDSASAPIRQIIESLRFLQPQ